MTLSQICLIFGVVPSTASEIWLVMMPLICKKLKNHPAAEIRFPNAITMAHLAELVNHREPSVDNVIAFVDGLSIPIQCSDSIEDQAAFYNGYHHDTCINNVFAFAPTAALT